MPVQLQKIAEESKQVQRTREKISKEMLNLAERTTKESLQMTLKKIQDRIENTPSRESLKGRKVVLERKPADQKTKSILEKILSGSFQSGS